MEAKKIIGLLGVSLCVVSICLNRKEIKNLLDHFFEFRIEDVNRLRKWKKPLYRHRIITVDNLINVVSEKGLSHLKSFDGIGDSGLFEIQQYILEKTGKLYKM
jgi:hypothetical protein